MTPKRIRRISTIIALSVWAVVVTVTVLVMNGRLLLPL